MLLSELHYLERAVLYTDHSHTLFVNACCTFIMVNTVNIVHVDRCNSVNIDIKHESHLSEGMKMKIKIINHSTVTMYYT